MTLQRLRQAYEDLRGPLEELGIEAGPEVLDVWLDRAAHGREPLPATALARLMDVVELLATAKR